MDYGPKGKENMNRETKAINPGEDVGGLNTNYHNIVGTHGNTITYEYKVIRLT